MTTDGDMPLQPPGENTSPEQLLSESSACLGDMRTALERLIQENEKLRARLAEERSSHTSTAATLASVFPENPADIEQPTDLAQWVIVTEPLPSRDDAR